MAFLVVLVLDDPDKTTDVLEHWEGTGVSGVTIFESTGLGRLRRSGIIDDLPLMPSLGTLLKGREIHHRTLFTVVHDQAQVDALVAATHEVVGDLDRDNTGFMYVVPVSQVYGLRDGPWAAEGE